MQNFKDWTIKLLLESHKITFFLLKEYLVSFYSEKNKIKISFWEIFHNKIDGGKLSKEFLIIIVMEIRAKKIKVMAKSLEHVWFLYSNTVFCVWIWKMVGWAENFLFGFCTQFLHSNIFTVQIILNSAKMRTTFSCFHLNSAWIRLLFKRPVAILKIPPTSCNDQ